jgi:alkylhydroperoxidase/carboxymuconolactone decarboxylase family protein YurZ
MDEQAVQRGLGKLSQMRGPAATGAIKAVIDGGGFGSELAALAAEFAFARVWDRPGLDAKYRSLVTISVLATEGRMGELRNHIDAGLNHGLTSAELEEAFMQISVYAGLPAAWSALGVAQEVMAERAAAADHPVTTCGIVSS